MHRKGGSGSMSGHAPQGRAPGARPWDQQEHGIPNPRAATARSLLDQVPEQHSLRVSITAVLDAASASSVTPSSAPGPNELTGRSRRYPAGSL